MIILMSLGLINTIFNLEYKETSTSLSEENSGEVTNHKLNLFVSSLPQPKNLSYA